MGYRLNLEAEMVSITTGKYVNNTEAGIDIADGVF